MPAHSTIKAVLTQLQHVFTRYGRVGSWDPLGLTGNPCLSAEIDQYRTGYQRMLWNNGVEPVAAHPLTEDKIHALVASLDKKLSGLSADQDTFAPGQPTSMKYLLIERDIVLYLYLWASYQRGSEGARLRPCDIKRPAGHPAFEVRAGSVVPTYSYPLDVHPNGTKSRQRRNCGSFTLELPCTDLTFDLVHRLNTFVMHCEQQGDMFRSDTCFFRPIRCAKRDRFSLEGSLSGSACLKRLKGALSEHSIDDGETCHSFRRGALQHAQLAGHNVDSSMDQAQITTMSTYERYVSTTRPTRVRAPDSATREQD